MNRRMTVWAVVIVALALGAVALAQGGRGMSGGGMGAGWCGGGPGMNGGGPAGYMHGSGRGLMGGHGWWSGPMSNSLNLTDAQKQKAQSIFDSSYRETQSLRDQMQQKNSASWNSKKPLTDDQIDKLAAERAQLMTKMQVTRQKAWNNVYNNVLTAEQRAKYDELRASAGPGPGMGRGNGYGRHGRMW